MSDQEPPHPDHSAALAALVGTDPGAPELAPAPVNRPMIQHWVEAMGDADPVYVDDEAARAAGLTGVIAPPTMLQAWAMRGLRATQARDAGRQGDAGSPPGRTEATPTANDSMMALLDEEGMTSVVATNCEQTYHRPLVPGDRLVATSSIEAISDVKRTGLGTGRFVTTRLAFVAVPDSEVGPDPDPAKLMASGEPVATMRFRILKFRPRVAATVAEDSAAPPAPGGTGPTGAGPAGAGERPLRPRPAITPDNAFFFEGLRQCRLLIQRCTRCGTLRHPPLPACAHCRSFEWDTVEASGRGELYSFVVVHYPKVPAFDYPLAIGLVLLNEGTRLVADLSAPRDRLRIGMPLEAALVAFDEGLVLPVFGEPGAATDGPPNRAVPTDPSSEVR